METSHSSSGAASRQECARLIRRAFNRLKEKRECNLSVIVDEYANQFNCAASTIRNWMNGRQRPRQTNRIETLARDAVRRAGLDEQWLRAFLHCVETDAKLEQTLLAELFPRPAALPSPKQAIPDLPASWFTPQPVHKGRHLPYRPYRILRGRENELEKLNALLADPTGPPAISISGVGGLGKTALARELAGHLRDVTDFVDVLWISAQRQISIGADIHSLDPGVQDFEQVIDQLFAQTGLAEAMKQSKSLVDKRSALVDLFQTQPYLITLDNLDDIVNELELMQRTLEILGRSRLLITTRHRKVDSLPLVRPFHLAGLSEEESVRYLREEGTYRGLVTLAQAERADLAEVHHLTGGAPLALNLVIGQAQTWALETVLAHLRAASGLDERFYTFLFLKDWQTLEKSARRLLIYIGRMVVTSVTQAQLRQAAVVEQGFDAALDALIKLCLLETNESLHEADKRFSLHPLVRHFVLSELPTLWTSTVS